MEHLSVIKMERFIHRGMLNGFFFLCLAACAGCASVHGAASTEPNASAIQRYLYRAHVDNGDKPGYWISLYRHGETVQWGEFILTPPDSTKTYTGRYSYRRQIVIEKRQDLQVEGEVDFTGPGRTPPNVDKIRIVFNRPLGKEGAVPARIYWADGDVWPENDDGIDVSFTVTPLY